MPDQRGGAEVQGVVAGQVHAHRPEDGVRQTGRAAQSLQMSGHRGHPHGQLPICLPEDLVKYWIKFCEKKVRGNFNF